tara:strand:+ start:610 stop:825 length:216 start_codon:yes stop_codon:yes gene_type:complete
MTWIPIWSKVSNVLIAPVIIPVLSYGLFSYILSGNNVYDDVKRDKEEMIRWSASLSDPDNPNYNPFILRNK